MPNYGFSDDEWERGKDHTHKILADVARREDTIPYSDLVARIGEIALDPCVHVTTVQHDSGGGPFELRAFVAGSDNGVAVYHRP